MNEEKEKPSYASIAFYLLTWAILCLVGYELIRKFLGFFNRVMFPFNL